MGEQRTSERPDTPKDLLVPWASPSGPFPPIVDWLGLHDDAEGFRILVQECKPDPSFGRRLRVAFDRPYAYRVADEGRRWRMLVQLDRVDRSLVYVVEDSSFVAWAIAEAGGCLAHPPLRHYLVMTTDDCVDVLSDLPPTLTWLDVD